MGGIYRKGAFLTTFAERSAEAAIPLDGSKRAQDLWTQAGQILGLLPVTQPVSYTIPAMPKMPDVPQMPTIPKISTAPQIFTQTQPTYRPIFNPQSFPSIDIPDNPPLSLPIAGDISNRLVTSSTPTINVTINVNISGNADEQTVRRGVESALPQLDDWFERYSEHQREERRRSYA